MKAQVLREFGSPDNMSLEDVPPPTLGLGQVCVDVHAAGVNFTDILMCQGKYQKAPELPFVPGTEISGIVSEMAAGAEGMYVGDRVMAKVPFGGFAEQAAVNSVDCWLAPGGLSMTQVAGFPMAYGTAYMALNRRAKIQKNEILLVHAATSGIGLPAVEIGKAFGATVIATSGSDEKLKIAKKHGADHLINYTTENVYDRVQELVGAVDVVYDPIGGDIFTQSLRCVKSEGRIIIAGFAAGDIQQIPANHLLAKNIDIIGFHWEGYAKFKPQIYRESFKELHRIFDQGYLKPSVGHEVPFKDTPTALNFLASQKATGKVVVKMRDDDEK